MRKQHGVVSFLLGICLALCLTGCGSSTAFLHEEADWGFYEKVGVLPFASLTNDRLAGDKMSSAFTSHLLFARNFNVAEPGQFLAAYTTAIGANTSPPIGLPLDKLKSLGEAAGVQAIFEGTVRDYNEGANAGRPLISVEVRLVDVGTGTIVWSTSLTRRGGAAVPLLGLGGSRTLPELTEAVAAELVDRLPD